MKKINQQEILKLIHNKGPISRSEIAEITGLVPATVSNIVKEFIHMNLVKEAARGVSNGGRKPILLEINPLGAYVMGLEWGISEIKGVLLNLNSETVMSKCVEVNNFEPENFVQATEEMINEFFSHLSNAQKVLGIGIGLHGLVDVKEGISLYAPHFHWENINIKQILSERLDLPIFLDNDVRVMAMGEKWSGPNREIENFIFINSGLGIGSAIVIKNELLYGRDSAAGEFGHMTIVEDGPVCSCGNNGCLESLVSINRLVSEYDPAYSSIKSYYNLQRKWEEMVEKAHSGDQKALQIINNAGEYLGTGISNLVNLINPQAIVIGGELIKARDIILPTIREQVKRQSLKIPGDHLQIMTATFGENSGPFGAATMVLQKLMKLEKELI